MSTAPSASPEVLAVVKEFKRLLGSAKLKDTVLNGQLIAVWCNAHKGGVASAENMYEATKAIYAQLEWDVPPAILVRDQNEQKINKIVPAYKSAEERAAIEKAAEAKAAKEKADAKFEKETASLIANYLPINSAGRVAYGAQASHQKRISDWVTASKARGVSAEAIFKAVQNEINRLYSVAEKSAERV